MKATPHPGRWYSVAELANHFGKTPGEIEALARRHHWARVTRPHSVEIGVDFETVERALGSTPSTVHGSITPQ